MNTISLWRAVTENVPTYPSLEEDIDVDVAIIGAGITGATTALKLAKHGLKVAIVEAKQICGGTTGDSTGNLYVPIQANFQDVIKKFNVEVAKIVAQSRRFAIDYIAQIVQENNLSCHFGWRPWYIYTDEVDKLNFLDDEIEAFQKVDLPVQYVSEMPLPLKFKKAAMLSNQARINPFQYVIGLIDVLHKHGCHIFENSAATEIEELKTKCIVHTRAGKIGAKKVVIATHTPIGIHPVQLYLAPYRSYVVAVKLKDNYYPEGHFWDLKVPHHAICTHPINGEHPQTLMVAGNHHKTGQANDTKEKYTELQKFLDTTFEVEKTIYEWSAQHYQSADGIPYIGLSHGSKNIYEATGYFADGLVYGTVAGVIIANQILDQQEKWHDIYRISRFKPLASAGFLMCENSNVFLQYLKDFPTKSPTSKTFDDIKKGEGRIIEIDREKCAVARDENNKVFVVSAVCTHMKCIVHWNNAEKTWDCPCHGSRFEIDGKYIEGPAMQDLSPKSHKEEV